MISKLVYVMHESMKTKEPKKLCYLVCNFPTCTTVQHNSTTQQNEWKNHHNGNFFKLFFYVENFCCCILLFLRHEDNWVNSLTKVGYETQFTINRKRRLKWVCLNRCEKSWKIYWQSSVDSRQSSFRSFCRSKFHNFHFSRVLTCHMK